jgi:hypothetical protein
MDKVTVENLIKTETVMDVAGKEWIKRTKHRASN